MPHWDPDAVDHLEPIGDDEAIEMTLRLAREEGIFAGISTRRERRRRAPARGAARARTR